MQKIIILLLIVPTFIYASYNPFFSDDKPDIPPAPVVKTVIEVVKPKPVPERKNIKMTYFGFVESKKGKFALVSFNNKNIVIRQADSLYLDEQIFKVISITSNYILFSDRRSRKQTVYFSSEENQQQRHQQ